MIKNYFKIALRNLRQNFVFTILNIAGLSIGVSASLILFVIYNYESGVDEFHENANRIYRVVRSTSFPSGDIEHSPGNPLPLANALKMDFPQIEKVVPTWGTIEPQITILGKDKEKAGFPVKFLEENLGLMTEPAFFEMFDFKWIQGQKDVLKDPNILVVTRNRANKYFGDWREAVGQFVMINNKTVMQVGGVLEDLPPNTDFPIDIVMSYETKRRSPELFGGGDFSNWNGFSSNDQIFVLLPEGAKLTAINSLLQQAADKHINTKDSKYKTVQFLSPLVDQHRDKRFLNYSRRQTSNETLINLWLIGGVIIGMACINFVNLSIVQSFRRSKEVGVRRVLGSGALELGVQFFSETFVTVFVSVIFGIVLSICCLPILRQVSDVPARVDQILTPYMGVYICLLTLVLVVISGFYPAIIISGFRPIEALRNKISTRSLSGIPARKLLIIVQFAITQVLLIGTIVSLMQMRYLDKMDLGFNKEGIFTLLLDRSYGSKLQSLKNQLVGISGVEYGTIASDVPSSRNNMSCRFAFDNRATDEGFYVFNKFGDHDYFDTFGMRFVAGEPYGYGDSTLRCVINKTLAKKLGFNDPTKIVGKKINLAGSGWREIVGVVDNFKVNSAREGEKPVVILPETMFYSQLSLKLISTNLSKTVSGIHEIFNSHFPEAAFNGKFLDQSIQAYYDQERRIGIMFQIFSAISIFIACLGLSGLASAISQQRTKEIGVRKALGASSLSVLLLFAKDFFWLVIIAVVCASPIAFYLMNSWLQSFVDRIDVDWRILGGCGFFLLVIALITVCFQSFKVASANPIESLKVE